MEYIKKGTKFQRKYGKQCAELARELGVAKSTLIWWDQSGFDVYEHAKNRNALKGNRRLQRAWTNMNRRCYSPIEQGFQYYGGKGIKVELTKEDMVRLWNRDAAASMHKPSLDRIDPNLNYTYNNCRFIEMRENSRRACKGVRVSKLKLSKELLVEFLKLYPETPETLKERVERLLNT